MRNLLTTLTVWLALSSAALAQCTGGISACPAATSVNPSDLTLVAQAGGTGPTGYVTRKATIQQLTAGVASTLLASNNVFTGTNSFTNTFLVSGAAGFSGGLTSLTATPGDNSGTVATTAFVQAALTASIANIFTTPHTWTPLQTFNGGVAGSGPVGMLNTTTPASFMTPGYSFNDNGIVGFNFGDGNVHVAMTVTGNSPATGTGGYTGILATQFGVGRTSSAFVTGIQGNAIAIGGNGSFTGVNPYVLICGTTVSALCPLGTAATVLSAVGMEADVDIRAGATALYKEAVRLVDLGTVQASGSGNLSAAIVAVRASTAPGFVYGIYFGDPTNGDSNFPLTTTGAAMKLSTTARAIDSIIDGSGLAGGVTNGAIRLPDNVAGIKWASWSLLETGSLIAFQAGGGVNAALIQTTASTFSGTVLSGNQGTNAGAFLIQALTAGTVTIQPGSASFTSFNFNLPVAAGSANQPLLSGGGGAAAMTFSSISYPASAISGGIPYFSATTAISSSALLAANAIVVGGGGGVAPSTPATTPPTISSAGLVNIPNATVSTAAGNGALVVAGGIGVGGNSFFNGVITITAPNATTFLAMSGSPTAFALMAVGRTAAEFEFGIAGAAGNFFSQVAAGDSVLFATGNLFIGYANDPAAKSIFFMANSHVSPSLIIAEMFPSTGVYFGSTPVDPGANNVTVQGALFVGSTTKGGISTAGVFSATLASAIGTNAVCNTPGTNTNLTVQVWATGCAASSERFKRDIIAVDPIKALADVVAFRAVSYYYRPEFSMGDDLHVGFTAEQVGAIDRQWITFEQDGVTPHAVKYNEMAPLLAAAIQQLKADNDNLRAEMRALRSGAR